MKIQKVLEDLQMGGILFPKVLRQYKVFRGVKRKSGGSVSKESWRDFLWRATIL